jgi:hypothetical protein
MPHFSITAWITVGYVVLNRTVVDATIKTFYYSDYGLQDFERNGRDNKR